MPRRTLLSSEQRMRLFGIPAETVEMAKHYVLSVATHTPVSRLFWHENGRFRATDA
jgi:hypothetical protein